MLDRRTTKDKEQRRAASRLYRARQRADEFILRVPVNARTLAWMIEVTGWISEQDAAEGDRVRLGLLVGAGLALSASKASKEPRPD